MMVAKWECGHVYDRDIEGHAKAGERCTMSASGCGGSIGLIAIGWHFEPGKPDSLRCPAHRPDRTPCRDQDYAGRSSKNWGKPCSACRAESEAKRYQGALGDLDALAARLHERLTSDDEKRELEAYRAGNAGTQALIDTLTVERDEARQNADSATADIEEVRRTVESARRLLAEVSP